MDPGPSSMIYNIEYGHHKKTISMVEDIYTHVIGIAESWANKYIAGAQLVLTGYVMFRRGRRREGELFYILKYLFK